LSWKHGRALALADYLRAFPELGSIDDLPAELLVAEYRVRQEHGRADLSDFAERYPTRIDDLYVLLKPEVFEGPAAPAPADDMTQSQMARRMQLLRTPAESGANDRVADRRMQLIRGDTSGETAPPRPAPAAPQGD